MTSSFRTNATVVASCMDRLRAIASHSLAGTQLSLDGRAYSGKEVAAVFQASLDARAAVAHAQAVLKIALAKRDAAESQRQKIDRDLRTWVIAYFGPESQVLAEFGYTRARVGKKSAEVRMNAAKKALATRKARNTMGKKARRKIKGKIG